MGAPKGNSYYLLAVGFKKPKLYQPPALWKKAIEYFEWVDKHPLKSKKPFANGKQTDVKHLRAMTIKEFCLFASMDRSTFIDYESQKDYSDIIERIKSIIYTQKFQGAAAELFNPSIIARELGMADKTEISGPGGVPLQAAHEIDETKLTVEQLEALMNARKKE